jgi:hypothetical protein
MPFPVDRGGSMGARVIVLLYIRGGAGKIPTLAWIPYMCHGGGAHSALASGKTLPPLYRRGVLRIEQSVNAVGV